MIGDCIASDDKAGCSRLTGLATRVTPKCRFGTPKNLYCCTCIVVLTVHSRSLFVRSSDFAEKNPPRHCPTRSQAPQTKVGTLPLKTPRRRIEYITASLATSLSNHKLPIRFSNLGYLSLLQDRVRT
eukprot:6180711-Amphidinium_carterae.1